MAESKLRIISIVVLRILTLSTCTAACVLIVLNNFTFHGQQTNFTSIRGYWYVLPAGGVGVLYSLFQLPFALYHAVKGKRLIKGQFLPMLDFYGDKLIALLLASGFGVSIELKNFIDESIDKNDVIEFGDKSDNFFDIGELAKEFTDFFDIGELTKEFRDKSDNFFDIGIIACGILLAGFTTMAILAILSSAKHTDRNF